jgi:hypothetical protein
MKRRELLVLLTGAMAVTRPLLAQQKAMPVIGSRLRHARLGCPVGGRIP